MKRKRVLVTPLDWGLGHATRCIPVVAELQRQGCEVAVAGSGDSLALLHAEFPELPVFPLPGYAPEYPTNGNMVFRMARQLPKFIRVIREEHKAVEDIIRNNAIDLLISDNRYGCWSDRIPSVFITHQSNIMMPKRFGFLHSVVRRQNERMINRFRTCWIPDRPPQNSMTGALISFGKMSVSSDIEYVGWLSRFRKDMPTPEKRFDVLVICSGPEPQRTIFEEIVVAQLRSTSLRYRIVRGLPGSKREETSEVVNFLGSRALKSMIEQSELVVARSGYSTIMDMSALGARAAFVPTPGQTEQEYLARLLMERKIAFAMPQQEFNIGTAISQSKMFAGFEPSPENDLLRRAIANLIG